jgi:hypothetical protein
VQGGRRSRQIASSRAMAKALVDVGHRYQMSLNLR